MVKHALQRRKALEKHMDKVLKEKTSAGRVDENTEAIIQRTGKTCSISGSPNRVVS